MAFLTFSNGEGFILFNNKTTLLKKPY